VDDSKRLDKVWVVLFEGNGDGNGPLLVRMANVESVMKAIPLMNAKLDLLVADHNSREGAEDAITKRETMLDKATEKRDRRLSILIALVSVGITLLIWLLAANHGQHSSLRTANPIVAQYNSNIPPR